ncbi:succinate- ligase [Nannochloropsis gaditana]|uniref:Succinate--CoA ligase [ADP-forming] subunit beta, mitochondrial n=1 Tax=Nannochloropsis gaditana TaxID=72520 RepID=W7TUJ9_9STRA|nr:succinate- ligase [Nannochloropsis gaditana]
MYRAIMNSARLSGAKQKALLRGQQARMLNVHEYISMDIMKGYGIATPTGQVVSSVDEAEHVYVNMLNKGDAVVKAQVLSGGRGLGTFKNGFKGGVHLATTLGDVKKFTESMLGQHLVTKQSGPAGIVCNKVLLVERLYMRREMYLSIMMDRTTQGPMIVASPVGGTSIEDVAASNPEKIFTEPIDIMEGLSEEAAAGIATKIGLEPGTATHAAGADLVKRLYKMMIATDATLVEINPLAETNDGRIVAADAKLNFDDNAEYRQKQIFAKRDYTQEDPREVEAHKYDLNYIGLSGNIGCMVNGAGLAMSTMDIIKLKGGDPANFLDVGGGATEEQVHKAFEILNADPKVKTILVNIFGGIMRCDVIAAGILSAAKQIGMKKPIVIRLQGTNVDEAQKLIQASGFRMIVVDELEEAATKAVAIANIVKQAEDVKIDVQVNNPTFLPL